MFDLEATAKLLQFNNMALSVIVESRYSLVGELNDRVTVFEDDRVVVKASLRQIHKDIRDDPPRARQGGGGPQGGKGRCYISRFRFSERPPSASCSFLCCRLFRRASLISSAVFSFLFNFTPEVKDMRSNIKAMRSYHSSSLSSLRYLIKNRDNLILGSESNLTTIGLYVNHLK